MPSQKYLFWHFFFPKKNEKWKNYDFREFLTNRVGFECFNWNKIMSKFLIKLSNPELSTDFCFESWFFFVWIEKKLILDWISRKKRKEHLNKLEWWLKNCPRFVEERHQFERIHSKMSKLCGWLCLDRSNLCYLDSWTSCCSKQQTFLALVCNFDGKLSNFCGLMKKMSKLWEILRDFQWNWELVLSILKFERDCSIKE